MADISKIKLPDGTIYDIKALNATDTKVTQTETTASTDTFYELLFSGTADDRTRTEGARKNSALLANPYRGQLKTTQVRSEIFIAQDSENTGATTISPDMSYFNGSIQVSGDANIGGNVSCSGISVTDISEDYVATKSSGNWSLAREDIEVVRAGNFVQIRLSFKGNGNAVAGPTNAFVGSLSGGSLPWFPTTLVGYYNAVAVMAIFDTDGSITVRPLGSITLSSSGRVRITGMFICADDAVEEQSEGE